MSKENKENLPAVIESQDIFERFEQMDDKVIIQLLEDQVAEAWVYHFQQDGKDIWGIGKAGIDGCAKEMGTKGVALREDSVDFMIDPTHPEFVLFTAKVSKHVVDEKGNEAMVETAIGTKRQWIMLKRRSDGKLTTNKFWFEQGSQKALRNAKARLIPDDIKAKILAFAKSKGKVREIEPPAKKKEDDNGIADMASPGPGSEEFRTIPITRKGKTIMHTKFEALDRFKEAKAQLGTQLYYKILGENGYEKSNQIPDNDIPKIYYALIEAHKDMKPADKKAAPKKEAAVFPDDKEKAEDPPSEAPEKIQPEMPAHAEIMELTRIEAMLADSYGFTAEQILKKLTEKIGENDATKMTKEQTKDAIKYFKGVIEDLDKSE